MKPNGTIHKVIGDSGRYHNPRPLGTRVDWRLKVDGCVEKPREFSIDELERLATTPFSATIGITCVSEGRICGPADKATFEGIPFSVIAEAVRPKGPVEEFSPTVELISKAPAGCGPKQERHRTALPLRDCLDPEYGVMLAWGLSGQPLPYANGGPLRSVVGPKLFFYKAIKWLDRINIIDKPLSQCRGTWEKYAGYHSRARVDLDERFEPQMQLILDVAEDGCDVTRFITDEAEQRKTFEQAYRDRNLSRLVAAQLHLLMKPDFPTDYSGFSFSDGRFKAKIRGTNFSGATFHGAGMAGANFSLSKFSNARFSRNGDDPADLRGCDFEGAYLNNAHLQNVSMQRARLGGAVFVLDGNLDKPTDRVRRLDVRSAVQLDEETADWLKRNGAIVD